MSRTSPGRLSAPASPGLERSLTDSVPNAIEWPGRAASSSRRDAVMGSARQAAHVSADQGAVVAGVVEAGRAGRRSQPRCRSRRPVARRREWGRSR